MKSITPLCKDDQVRREEWVEDSYVLPNPRIEDVKSVNIGYHSDTRRIEFMQSRLKFANLLSQHYHIHALHHLLLALLLCRPSLLNLQRCTNQLFRPSENGWLQGGKLCRILSALSVSSTARVYTNRLQRTLN